MLQAIVFDLDGTLLDTEPDFTAILNGMLARHGRPAMGREAMRATVSSGARAMVRLGFGMAEGDARVESMLAEFLDLYAASLAATQAALFEDVDLLLATLTERGLPWGIMTNKARRFSEPLLERFESFATCATLVCPDDVGKKGKPDPAGLLLACSQLQSEPAHTLYVGDHPRDIEAAVRAGMPSAAVSWGYLPEDSDISTWGAGFIAATPQALLCHPGLAGGN